MDIDITELMLLSEKEDYEKKHGDCESRINFAVYEIERLLDEKTEQIESCGGTVTPEHEKKNGFLKIWIALRRNIMFQKEP